LSSQFTLKRRRRPVRPEIAQALDALYAELNQRAFVYPDPLSPVYDFDDPHDIEVAGLIAASLAFGNVKTILASIDRILRVLPDPARAVDTLDEAEMAHRLRDFRHRYVTGVEMTVMLQGARQVRAEYGSLGACFAAQVQPADDTILPALARFVACLEAGSLLSKNYLLPCPLRGSACKRWMMYLRWMVRNDAVDLGVWPGVDPALLVVPMDTHMHRVSKRLGLTRRKTADLRAALEVTAAFRTVAPNDPVRYDFCLTRLGIRTDTDMEAFLETCGKGRRRRKGPKT
jgi:uncharacterized protein (TIGR02757 family)